MAEVIIGVVASGITVGTLAAQITSSIIKIKGYWNQIQSAPEDVLDLMEELEIFSNLLTDIQDGQQPMSSLIVDSNSTSRCLEYCKKAAEQLKNLTENLSVDLEARKWMPRKRASVKVVLKKDKIDRYKAQLERAFKLLTLAHQLYTSFLLRLQPDILVAKLSHFMVPIPQPGTEGASDHQQTSQRDNALNTKTSTSIRSDLYRSSSLIFGNLVCSRSYHPITKRRGKTDVEVIVAQYRSPSWLVNKMWQIQAVKASQGWDFSPRAYNVVHVHSPVFICARDNNVRGLQELFSDRTASPFDCDDDYGWTPLAAAAASGSFEACELLIKEGADPNYLVGIGCYTALQCAMMSSVRCSNEIPRLLFNETEFTPSLSNYRGSANGFVLWQEALDPIYYQRPLEERLEIARVVALGNEYEVFKKALDRDSILHPLTKENCETANVIAQSIGRKWGSFSQDTDGSLVSYHELRREDLEAWVSMLRDVVALKYNLHHISTLSRTPFLDAVQGIIYYLNFNQEPQLPWLLDIWLGGLQNCGVVLQEYGRKETELFQQGLVHWAFLSLLEDTWRITNLTYGSLPSDWSISVERVDDADTETPSNMPGAWIEDDDSERKEDDDSEGEVGGAKVAGE